MRFRALAAAAVVILLAACTDTTSPPIKGASANRRIIAPSGTLDQNINQLLDLFPKGLATAGRNRWGNVKAKYQTGLTKPSDMAVSRKMLFELAQWVKEKAPEMSTPPDNETKTAAAARLTLYMSQYVYQGPSYTPPPFLPEADAAVALVSPTEEATVVTPQETAGIGLEEGSVAEETIIVITENPTPYPDNCSGPLPTRLCQYPRFYSFDQFPHVKLLKAAKFAVCHVNSGPSREPLADHDRFRLAHNLPANPADYTPGSTIRDQGGEAIEILPFVTQTFSICDDVEYALNQPTGFSGAMTRLAKAVGKAISPKKAYAIDQGGGGESFTFSDFNIVDPDGRPDDNVTTTTTEDTTHSGDHVGVTYKVKNNGTATMTPQVATLSFNTGMPSPSVMVLGSQPLPALLPGDSAIYSTEIVVPPSVMVGGAYSVNVTVSADPYLADDNAVNSVGARPLAIEQSFHTIAPRANTAETSVCALNPSNALLCWGENTNWQVLGAAGPSQSSPFQTATLQLGLVEIARGTASQFVCGIKADRSAQCWGRNGFGQLGRGVQGGAQSAPAAVLGGVQWKEITTNRLSACGVSTTNVGYCWGSNQRGEVGRMAVAPGTSLASMTLQPAILDGSLSWKSVVAGWTFACGITTTGSAYCWGDNNRGQVGIGAADTVAHRVPTPVLGGHTFIQLSLSATHACGITDTHELYCWGENHTGQVGNGTLFNVPTPTRIGAPMRFSYVAVGSNFEAGPATAQASNGHSCALAENGNAWCWGLNNVGQLGNGTNIDSTVPVQVSGSLRFTSLSSGGAETCGRAGNRMWCWGINSVGQLGIGSLVNANVPTLVGSPFNVP